MVNYNLTILLMSVKRFKLKNQIHQKINYDLPFKLFYKSRKYIFSYYRIQTMILKYSTI